MLWKGQRRRPREKGRRKKLITDKRENVRSKEKITKKQVGCVEE